MTKINKISVFSACFFFLFLSLLVVYIHTPFGVAFSMDSLSYMSAAQQINLGHGVSLPDYAMDGKGFVPMTLWPPLYPLLLSLLIPGNQVFGVNAGYPLIWVNALTLFITLIIFWAILIRFFGKASAFFATLILAFMPSVQIIYMYAWSETFFIPVVMAAFYFFIRFISSRYQHISFLLAALLFLAIGFYLRYAVLGFSCALALSILFIDELVFKKRIKLFLLAVSVFSLLIVPLLIRNFLLTNTIIGHREAPTADFLTDLITLATLLANEFLSSIPYFWPFAIVFLLFLVVVIFCKRKNLKNESKNEYYLFVYASLWAGVYLLFLMANRLLSHMDLDTRMIGPMVPFGILVFCGLLYLSSRIIRSLLVVAPLFFFIAALLFTSYQIHRDLIISWRNTGAPGQVLGITYNSMTNYDFSAFQRLGNLVHLNKDDLILTDLDRPQLLHYFFPMAKVRYISSELSPGEMVNLGAHLNVQGLIVMTKKETIIAFEQHVDTSSFLQTRDSSGQADNSFILLKLPLLFKN